ncbi:MAG: hypothetical protein HFJ41_01815 [Clostridia bacterium]|nr:hypothetical protein [Clostridia bacterium]
MELNKCSRCGAFYTTSNNVCPNCVPKDNCDQLNLKNFLAENEMPESIEALSANTGISVKNLNRYLTNDDINICL